MFDSGVGGLTVLRALRRKLPHRDFIYVGDTARLPYGRKPAAMVESFAREITAFLIDEGAEAVVIACNTASSAALPQLAKESSVPVWGVIEPGVEAAIRATRTGQVGVIGTKGTIRNGVYRRKLEERGLSVWDRACPMFVHLVEEGLANSPEATLLAQHYLQDRPEIDALILGCTHYPVLRETLAEVLGSSVHLVDSAESTASVVSAKISDGFGSGSITHFVTGDTKAYEHTAEVIGGVDGKIVFLPVDELALHTALSNAL